MRWRRFCLTVPWQPSMRYERGLVCSPSTVPGIFWSVTHTDCPGEGLLSSLVLWCLLYFYVSLILLFLSFLATEAPLERAGLSKAGSIGNGMYSCLPLRIWAGLYPVCSVVTVPTKPSTGQLPFWGDPSQPLLHVQLCHYFGVLSEAIWLGKWCEGPSRNLQPIICHQCLKMTLTSVNSERVNRAISTYQSELYCQLCCIRYINA